MCRCWYHSLPFTSCTTVTDVLLLVPQPTDVLLLVPQPTDMLLLVPQPTIHLLYNCYRCAVAGTTAYHSPPSCTGVKSKWSHTSTTPIRFHDIDRDKVQILKSVEERNPHFMSLDWLQQHNVWCDHLLREKN